VNAGVKAAFPGHAVKTVAEISWRASRDAPLLAHAEKSFDVFVTIDRKLEREHDLKRLRLGFVVAHVSSNEIASFRPIFGALLKAAVSVKPGEVIHVEHAARAAGSGLASTNLSGTRALMAIRAADALPTRLGSG
jgi:hypothetical protein